MNSPTFTDIGIELPHGAYGEIDVPCPQCSPTRKKSRDKCLGVNTLDGTWYCHHCGWSGGLGTNSSGYGARLMPRASAPAPQRVYVMPPPVPEDPLPAQVIAWFATRGIPESVLAVAGIRWRDGAILFPYRRCGTLINIKHRTPDKRFWMVAGAERILYGVDHIRGAETICLVEGEIDKLSIDTTGGPATVSVPDGAPAVDARHYASKFSFLDATALAHLRAATTVLIATDMDAPGQKLADELARRIGYARCMRVSWHPYKDANDLLVAQGPTAVPDALAAAEPFPVSLDDEMPQRTRPMRPLPPGRGRRPVIALTPEEAMDAR
jgi:twinkle protein